MRKRIVTIAIALCWLIAPALSQATDVQTEGIALSSKVPVSFYGFITAQGIYTDSTVQTLDPTNASTINALTGINSVENEKAAGAANNNAAIGFTAQNSRFGFLFSPYTIGNASFDVDARLEFDLFSTTLTNIHGLSPRIRRAYFGMGGDSWHVLLGQEWDLFSPLNVASFDFVNMWQMGNLGIRRPQLRYMYTHDVSEETGIETGMSLGLPSNNLNFANTSNDSAMPMLQGRLGLTHNLSAGKMKAYLSGVFHRTHAAQKINNWGLALSLYVPVHAYFKPSMEIHYGKSLGNLLSLTSTTTKQRALAGWAQVKSNWTDKVSTVVGYGMEMLKNSEVAAGAIKTNMDGFINISYSPVKPVSIGMQFDHIRTNYQVSGTSSANVGTLCAMYKF